MVGLGQTVFSGCRVKNIRRWGAVLLLAGIVLLRPVCGYSFCFQEAGAQYGINPLVLRSIAKVESGGNPAAVNRNVNGSYDIGVMQINTIWKSTMGAARWRYLGDPCYNVKTGAWILSGCIRSYGYNWKAIGCYNSRTPSKSEIYARKVFQKLKDLEKHPEREPLDKREREVMLSNIDELVQASIASKNKRSKKVVKFVPYVRLSTKESLMPPLPPSGEPLYPIPAYGGSSENEK